MESMILSQQVDDATKTAYTTMVVIDIMTVLLDGIYQRAILPFNSLWHMMNIDETDYEPEHYFAAKLMQHPLPIEPFICVFNRFKLLFDTWLDYICQRVGRDYVYKIPSLALEACLNYAKNSGQYVHGMSATSVRYKLPVDILQLINYFIMTPVLVKCSTNVIIPLSLNPHKNWDTAEYQREITSVFIVDFVNYYMQLVELNCHRNGSLILGDSLAIDKMAFPAIEICRQVQTNNMYNTLQFRILLATLLHIIETTPEEKIISCQGFALSVLFPLTYEIYQDCLIPVLIGMYKEHIQDIHIARTYYYLLSRYHLHMVPFKMSSGLFSFHPSSEYPTTDNITQEHYHCIISLICSVVSRQPISSVCFRWCQQ